MPELVGTERAKRLQAVAINEADLLALADLKSFSERQLPELLPLWNERFTD